MTIVTILKTNSIEWEMGIDEKSKQPKPNNNYKKLSKRIFLEKRYSQTMLNLILFGYNNMK